MAAIGVAHDDELAASFFNAFAQGAAIAFQDRVNYARTALLGNFDRTIRGPVISDDDFAGDGSLAKSGDCLINADTNRTRLIQAGNDNRHLDLAQFRRFQSLRTQSLRTRLFSEAEFQGRKHASPGEASFSGEDDAVPVPHAVIPSRRLFPV